MQNPFKRSKPTYTDEAERERLLEWLNSLKPTDTDYETVLKRLNELDRIHKRSSEFQKTIIPTLATGFGIAGIYGLQQFAGVIVPKALESIAARQEAKKSKELD